VARNAGGFLTRRSQTADRPPGRLRRLAAPELTRWQQQWAKVLYPVFDPDGTILRAEDLEEMTTPEMTTGH